MATTNDISNFIDELKTNIRDLPILASSEFNRYNKYGIKRLRDFREYLFNSKRN